MLPNEAAFSWDVGADTPDIKFFAFISGDNMFLKRCSLRSPRPGPCPFIQTWQARGRAPRSGEVPPPLPRTVFN